MSKTTTKAEQNNTAPEVVGVKSFKASAEVENFLRFVHENNLRTEARDLLQLVLSKAKAANKKSKRQNRKLQ